MKVLDWIDLNLSEIKDSLLYGKYFDSINLEKHVDEYSLFNPQLGIDLILREDLSVKAIHFYSGKIGAAKKFTGELPFDLDFFYSMDSMRKKLGFPNTFGGGDSSVLYGKTPYWDRYEFPKFFLHLQFSNDLKSIDLVTAYSSIEVI
jgi:hypothetical protein